MHIEHLAIWTRDLTKSFKYYCRYFSAQPSPLYRDESTGFSSYFLTFPSGARLELMQMPCIPENRNSVDHQAIGLVHLAFKIGGRAAVDALTARLRNDGYRVVTEPHETGDGYYESCVLDPDNVRVELVA